MKSTDSEQIALLESGKNCPQNIMMSSEQSENNNMEGKRLYDHWL